MHITKWRKPIRIGYTLYDSNYMTSVKGKTVETVKRLGGMGMNRQSTEDS